MVANAKDHLKVIIGTAEEKVVNGKPTTMTPENVAKYMRGEITLAQLQGLSMEQAYQIAEGGYQFFMQGKYKQAQNIFEGLIILNPYDGYFHSMLGSVLARSGEEDKAIREYSIAANLQPDDPKIFVSRGELLLKKGNFEEGLDDLKRAIAVDPTGKNPAVARAHSLGSATIALLEQMLASKPADAPQPAADAGKAKPKAKAKK